MRLKSGLLFFVLFGMGSNFCQAQLKFYFGAGYGVNYSKLDSLNQVISRYNNSLVLLKGLPEIHFPKGMTYEGGLLFKRLLVRGGYSIRKQVASGQISDGNQGQIQQDILLQINTLNLGVGLNILRGRRISISPGVSFDLGNFSIFAREGTPSSIKDYGFDRITADFNGFSTFFTQVMIGNSSKSGVKIVLEPYYNLKLGNSEIGLLKNYLDPGTNNSNSSLNIKPHFWGIKAMVIILFGL